MSILQRSIVGIIQVINHMSCHYIRCFPYHFDHWNADGFGSCGKGMYRVWDIVGVDDTAGNRMDTSSSV